MHASSAKHSEERVCSREIKSAGSPACYVSRGLLLCADLRWPLAVRAVHAELRLVSPGCASGFLRWSLLWEGNYALTMPKRGIHDKIWGRYHTVARSVRVGETRRYVVMSSEGWGLTLFSGDVRAGRRLIMLRCVCLCKWMWNSLTKLRGRKQEPAVQNFSFLLLTVRVITQKRCQLAHELIGSKFFPVAVAHGCNLVYSRAQSKTNRF